MSGVYIQKGDTIDYINNSEVNISYKDIVPIGGRIGIAGENIAVGTTGSLNVTGVFEMPAENTAAFTVGDEVYWDTAAGQLTKTPGTYRAGWVTEAKAQAGTVAKVKIS